MQTFTANEAKARFGEFLDRALREPVGVHIVAPAQALLMEDFFP
jgi:hypothetical protein